MELEEPDYEMRVEGLVEISSLSGELHHAVEMGDLESVRFLVEQKHYKPMQRDNQFKITALHMAALLGKMQILKYFVTECNCNPACPAPLGLTSLHLASQGCHLDVVKYLVIEQQIDPLCEDEFGNTPLYRACARGFQAVVEFLNCDPHLSVGQYGRTPLHTAAEWGHIYT